MFSKITSIFKKLKTKKNTKLIVSHSVVDFSASDLLKQATQLKKEKLYDEAIEKLKAAYVAYGHESLMTKDLLRLPMYLQLAGRKDDGWRILNEMNIKLTDVFSQADIANQMRVFLQKEKNFQQALVFSAWCICKEVERDRLNMEVFGDVKKGGSITDPGYLIVKERFEFSQRIEGVMATIKIDIKKAKLESKEQIICQSLSDYLLNTKSYQLAKIRDIVQAHTGS
jgi:hypothetical protein